MEHNSHKTACSQEVTSMFGSFPTNMVRIGFVRLFGHARTGHSEPEKTCMFTYEGNVDDAT